MNMKDNEMAKRTNSHSTLSNVDLQKSTGVKGRVVTGTLTAFFLVVALGGWAGTSELSGAVIAPGVIKVDEDLRAIQHLDGGIIRTISAKKGDTVKEGQILFTLDHTQMRAELQIVRGQLVELLAKRQRLLAERDQLEGMQPVDGYEELNLATSSVLKGEKRLFEGNRSNRTSQIEQLKLGVSQLEEEIKGLTSQGKANANELDLVENESKKVQMLQKKGLVDGARTYSSSRDLTKLKGERGQIEASIARSKSRRSEIELQILAIDETARNDAQKQLSEIEPRIAELLERKSAIADRLTRMDIRSPIAGTINEVSINTIGGIITPAQRLLTIVPEDARLQIEVKLQPTDIDQVFVGQPAKLRFSAFSARDTPELAGTVTFVSPATTTDSQSGQIHYIAQIAVSDSELVKLNGKQLVPGMPVEAFVQTESRTALSYLAKPFTDQLQRTFREQ
jgi:HlyD family type I secretion membrane fusion protein